MNCGWPIAPAHEPLHPGELDVAAVEDLERVEQLARGRAPTRRGSQASVASARDVGRTPLKRPKFDSDAPDGRR